MLLTEVDLPVKDAAVKSTLRAQKRTFARAARSVDMGQEPTSSSGLVNDIKDRRELTLWLRSSPGPSVRSSRSVGGLPLIYGVMDRLGHDPAILDQKRVSAVAHAGMLGLRRPLQKGDAPLYQTVSIDVRCSGQFLLQ